MQLQLDRSTLTGWSRRHYTVVQKVHELFSPIRDLAVVNPAEMKGFSYLIPCFSGDLIVYFPTRLHHQS